MGLFNRNKGDASAPSTPEAGTAPADTGTFDFDAISRDLDAQNGASSFDSLLAAPVNTAQQVPTEESSFDFPENDPLGLGTPPINAPTPTTRGPMPSAASPEAVINAPINPAMSPITGVAPLETAPDAPSLAPTATPRAKKALPLVPLLGALGLLAVVGGGAMFLLNSNQEPETTTPAVSTSTISQTPSGTAATVAASPAPGASVATGAPSVPAVSNAPGAPLAGLRSASPGIAPPPAPKQTIQSPNGSSNVSVTVGNSPTTGSPAATSGLDPALAAKLKALWQAGATAKHQNDYKAARAAWSEALRLRPGHPGFQESINKLPR
ncbi:hypothetical protein IAD21_02984 [Abditibacteriota bacterium]|nr:hypothetical protein IAD21_02984 [Abditibacteriota bacterium]